MKISDFLSEASKQRLDKSCWSGYRIGKPKTKVKNGVRVNNCVKESVRTVGRPLQHLEDLAIVDGIHGIQRGLNVLQSIANGTANAKLKWDGSVAIYFGRDSQSDFFLTDKSGYHATSYDGKAKSAEDLKKIIIGRNKRLDQDRLDFSDNMKNLFGMLEQTVPEDFRGTVFADVLFFEQPTVNRKQQFEFTPNTVTYRVPVNSKWGRKIKKSQVGIAIHQVNSNKDIVDLSFLNTTAEVFFVGPVVISDSVKINQNLLSKINQYVQENKKSIEYMFGKDQENQVKQVLYDFMNSQVETQDFSNLSNKFLNWFPQQINKKSDFVLKTLVNDIKPGIEIILNVVEEIIKIKEHVIKQLDKKSPVEQYIDKTRTGEGYLVNDVKLVSRIHFSANNKLR